MTLSPNAAHSLEVCLDEAREFGLGQGADKAAIGTPIRRATAPGRLAVQTQILPQRICRRAVRPEILGIELADQLLGHGLEFRDAGGLLGRAQGVMGYDQPVAGKGALGQTVLSRG